MKNFLSPDSFPIKVLTLFCDWMLLNLLFIICSLPVVTAGAATTALYSVWFKRMRGDDPKIFKAFFADFKANFKQATLFWIPYLIIICFLGSDVIISHKVLPDAYRFLQYPTSIALFLVIFTTVLVFPQMALFNSPTKQIIKNSVLLSLTNFPIIGMIIIIHVLVLLLAGLSATASVIVFSIFLFFGFGCFSWFFCIFYRKIFAKILGDNFEEQANPEEDGEEV